MSDKKTVLFHSSFSRLKTGFGSSAREVLKHLYATGKYNIVELANGIRFGDEAEKHTPWKCYGSLPSEFEMQGVTDQGTLRAIHYGAWKIDKVVEEVKPDVYIGCEDYWSFLGYKNKEWFKKTPHAIWTTLDSLPLYKPAVEDIKDLQNLWVWASFAEKEFKRLGHHNVTTVHGMFDLTKYFPFPPEKKKDLKAKLGLEDTTIFGFVFRNQLRKLVGSLLEGFAEFKKRNPKTKAKVLLHTNWSEGWDIRGFISEFGLDDKDVLCTYYCHACKQIDVTPFRGNGPEFKGVECRVCKQVAATNPTPHYCPTQEQLNVIYNLMDAYIHPATSGGLEMPIVEAMLCGLPAATVNYSFGEDFINSGLVRSLSHSTYREFQSAFIKASPNADSIMTFMERVVKNPVKHIEIGLKGRAWALKEFNSEKTGKFIEDFIDNAPKASAFVKEEVKSNPNYPFQEISDATTWIKDMYVNILGREGDEEGIKNWLRSVEAGRSRREIYDYFINIAQKEHGGKGRDIRDLIKKTDKKKVVYIMPESLGDCVISLNVVKQLREDYKDWELYVCTKPNNFMIFEPYLDIIDGGLIPYAGSFMDSFQFWEGSGQNRGLVDVAFQPYLVTQRIPSYTHNGEDKNYLQNYGITEGN